MSPFHEGNNAVMATEGSEAISAADEYRCTLIIVDSTSESSRRHTHTLPMSTTTDQLYEIVAKKLKYVKSSFLLVHSRTSTFSASQCNEIEMSKKRTLEHVGFSSEGKTYLKVEYKDGRNPAVSQLSTISESLGDESAASEWSYSRTLPSITLNSTIPPPPPPVPPKLLGGTIERRGAVSSTDTSFAENISEVASKLKGTDFKGTDSKGERLIGLVNQAMTCYLNSLIQTLYMTPEFRNALYEWEYKGTEEEAVTTMPFQLQRLFLALQTSDKQAVETTDLTKSFGWDSSEAWQQHDIQELCRVMFDALEQKFKESADESGKDDTAIPEAKAAPKKKEQEIIKLYEGNMKDYVQCEECKNETSRNDTYLDIAIPIRPFGSSTAYRSVMEGLKAFVAPEMLDGSNQYFCEKCNKKCDAKKGLKFTSFPYLLTLQLKRFDFDYTTFHRVKLNDRMYFPETLDLNSFIEEARKDAGKDLPKDRACDRASNSSGELEGHEGGEEIETSSWDSGNDDDRLKAVHKNTARSRNISDSECGSSVDEGIEIESRSGQGGAVGIVAVDDPVSSGNSSPAPPLTESDSNFEKLGSAETPTGKYVYELFSVMIHSGSAVGGHYYAYIKSFDDGQWYSFNDQIVSPISSEDMEKSYGGSGAFSTFSSSYSSSTNAYMLMYRRIDPGENKSFVKTENLPAHIKKLVNDEEERKVRLEEQREKEKNMCSIKVHCRHPALVRKKNVAIVDELFEFHKSLTLREATERAYKLLKLDQCHVALRNCRLVKYDNYHQSLEQSLDDETGNQDEPLSQLLGGSRMSYLVELLMETKLDNERFDVYPVGGVTIKVFRADYHKGCFLDQVNVRLMPTDNVYHLKQVLSKRFHYPHRRVRVAIEKFASDVQFLTCPTQTLRDIGVYRSMKIYVDLMNDEESQQMEQFGEEETDKFSTKYVSVKETRLGFLIERSANVITVDIELPEDAPVYELPTSRPVTPVLEEAPPSPTDSLPSLIDVPPTREIESCPKPPPGSERSTPSIDEGVGSYDGSSGSNSVPKTAECSACASPRDRVQSSESVPAFPAADARSDEKALYWQPGGGAQYEINKDETVDYSNFDVSPDGGNYMALSQSPARRNSEEDYDSPGRFSSNAASYADFEKLLGSKLNAAAINQSPTSSLQCEGGSSDSASDTSGEFEIPDMARQQGDGAADSAGSCSTIDSAGTLINNSDDVPWLEDFSEIPSATIAKSLPGIADAMLPASTVSPDETRNRHADQPINHEPQPCPINPEFCDCLRSDAGDNAAFSHHDGTGPGYLCARCGRMKSGCVAEKSGSDKAAAVHQDPESGEDMDNIEPLFGDLGSMGDSSRGEKTKYAESSSFGHSLGDANRCRTESSSSVLSDLGYGDHNHAQHVYFRVLSVDVNENKCQVLKAELDKRMTVGSLKEQIQPNLRYHTRNFSIYRIFHNGHESELNSLNDTFAMVTMDATLRIKHQRALRKDEMRCKIFQLNVANDDHVKYLTDYVLRKGLTIREAKEEICQILQKETSLRVKPEFVRLRRKKIRTPGKIFSDSDTFGPNIVMSLNTDLFLEVLEKPVASQSSNAMSVFCCRWRPSSLTLDTMEEVWVQDELLNTNYSVNDLKNRLAEISDLDVENVEWAKPKGTFPCLTNVLEIQDGLTWDPPFVVNLDCSPINIGEDGCVIYYRDKNEALKNLSDEQKTDIRQKEEKRLAVAMSSSGGSPRGSSTRPYQRKEKALKIYTVPSLSRK